MPRTLMLIHFFRQHPVFASAIGTALFAFVVLCAGITVSAIANHRAKAKLKQRQHELRTLAAAGLLLNEAEAKLAAEKVATLERQNAELFAHDSIWPKPGALIDGETVPTTQTDAFFELAAFVERMATRARSFDVHTAADERFGFAAYASNGPGPESIPLVLKQQEIVERVLAYLFAARPERLLSVSRERPPLASDAEKNSVGASNTDLFEFAPVHSLRTDGEISTSAVRIAFVGDTTVLRNFLNPMSEQDSRVLVRSVKAEALNDEASGRVAAGSQNRSQPSAIVQRTKFTVVVEAFEFLRSPLSEANSS